MISFFKKHHTETQVLEQMDKCIAELTKTCTELRALIQQLNGKVETV